MKITKRVLGLILSVALLISLFTIPVVSEAAPIQAYQQGLDYAGLEPWAYSYTNQGYYFAEWGCGIMSISNAINYMTNGATWIPPLEIARWACNNGYTTGSYGTNREALYPNLEAAFGAKYGFKVVNTGTYAGVGSSTLINHIAGPGVAVAHVSGHFIAIVDYRSSDGRYFVLDSAAWYPTRQTSTAGDWMTYGQLSGNLDKLTVDWWCLISPTGSTPSSSSCMARDSITVGSKVINPSGAISDNVTYELSNYVGKSVSFNGWYANKETISKFGYRINDDAIVYKDSFKGSAETAVANTAKAALGSSASYARFSVAIPVTANVNQTFRVYAKVGSNDVCIWTMPVLKGTPTVTSAPSTAKPTSAPSSLQTYFMRDSVSVGYTYLRQEGIPETIDLDLGKYAGQNVTFFGWLAGTSSISKIGYKLDGGSLVTDPSFMMTAEDGVVSAAKSVLGSNASSSRFYVDVPIKDNKAHTIKLYAYYGSQEVLFWSINCKASSATPVPTSKPTPVITEKPTSAPTKVPTTAKPTNVPTTPGRTNPPVTNVPGGNTTAPVRTNTPIKTQAPYYPIITEQPVINTEVPYNPTEPDVTENPVETEVPGPDMTEEPVVTTAPETTAETEEEEYEYYYEYDYTNLVIFLGAILGALVIASGVVVFLIIKKKKKNK